MKAKTSLQTAAPPRHRQTGVALVLVLWMLTLLTLMAGSYGYAMRNEARLTAHIIAASEARALAESGIWLAVADLQNPQDKRRWQTYGRAETLPINGHTLTLKIQDEVGKIDINTAPAELLHEVLQQTELKGDAVITLLHTILDWRDPDHHRHNLGAEDPEYRRHGLNYGSKDGPFNTLEELRLLLGMTESIYRKIHPLLTVHSRATGINPRAADKPVLLALTKATEQDIDHFLTTRKEANSPEETPNVPGLNKGYFHNTGGKTFHITSKAQVRQGKAKLSVVVYLGGDTYSILSWREAVPEYQ